MFYQILLFLNLGTPELVLIMFVALLLFGGKKLPELARGLGKGLRDFKEASDGLKTEIHNQINTIEESKPEAITYSNTVPEEAVYSDYHNTETITENTAPEAQSVQPVTAKAKAPRKKLKAEKS